MKIFVCFFEVYALKLRAAGKATHLLLNSLMTGCRPWQLGCLSLLENLLYS